jgi:deoxyadenosine/deoxycytidine kinase
LIFEGKTLVADELKLYNRFFQIIHSQLPKPDLFVFLYVDTPRLQQNIKKRGRPYEQDIQNEYLEKIQSGYFDFMKHQQQEMRILILDTNRLDFVHNPDHYKLITDTINKKYDVGIHRLIF